MKDIKGFYIFTLERLMTHTCKKVMPVIPFSFRYFWLTIQNAANRHVSSAFGLLAVFISFPLVRAAARPTHPAPLLGGEVPKKPKKKKIIGVGVVAARCIWRPS
jgi:hypothetical protein